MIRRPRHTNLHSANNMAFSLETSDSIVQQWQQTYDDLVQEGFVDEVNKKWIR